MRAREPDDDGYAGHDGVKLHFEVFGHGEPTVLFVPASPITFEQSLHVAHRLDRYRAGRRVDHDQTDPDRLAALIAAEIGRDTDHRPVETDGAARGAAMLAELL